MDSREAWLEKSGELGDSKVAKEQLIEIGECLTLDASHTPEGNVVCKCAGMGIIDHTIGRALLQLASNLGIATSVGGL